jgi:hypothetical protein
VAEDRCRLSLLDVDSGSITDHGLLFKGLLYESTELGLTYAYEKARAGRRKLLDIAFDPRLVDTVYIIQGNRERPDDYLPCQLNRDRVDQRRLAGRSFREVAVMLDLQTEAGRLHDIETRPLKAAWTQTQRDIVIRASARVDAIRATSDVSDSALMKGRPAAREAERNATSPKMALVPPLPAPGAESTHATTPSSTTVSQALASVVPVRARSASKATRLANRAAAVVSMSNDTTIDSGEPNDADHQ